MKAYGGMVIYFHLFLNSALVGGERSVSRLGRLTPVKESQVSIESNAEWATKDDLFCPSESAYQFSGSLIPIPTEIPRLT
jgi:hypothetical protein